MPHRVPCSCEFAEKKTGRFVAPQPAGIIRDGVEARRSATVRLVPNSACAYVPSASMSRRRLTWLRSTGRSSRSTLHTISCEMDA